jgi:hypothetical protein
MPICPICDDTGLQNSDPGEPEFCFCAAGRKARRQWEASQSPQIQGKNAPIKPASFIDITQLDQVNASVDALRASLLGSSEAAAAQTKHPAVQLLFQVAHPGHEISVVEATQLHDLAKVLEIFLMGLAPIGRTNRRG